MEWQHLTTENQLAEAIRNSTQKPVLLFKHSTRCSISKTTLDRLERNWKTNDNQVIEPYFLDLLSYRPISNLIAENLNIEHESPQAIVLFNQKVVYHASHFDINYQQILASASAVATN
ncbi:MAG: bacillithiol system redox-active protein YtxJ [Chryseotalea sp.]|jgi:bacillithiol system protein YtxJ|nr:bacillithiol system redox-active protein YtxJ [Flammeovirgaceae bacterium]